MSNCDYLETLGMLCPEDFENCTEENFDINTTNTKGTVLFYSLKFSNEKLCNYLIDKGIDTTKRGRSLNSVYPIFVACEKLLYGLFIRMTKLDKEWNGRKNTGINGYENNMLNTLCKCASFTRYNPKEFKYDQCEEKINNGIKILDYLLENGFNLNVRDNDSLPIFFAMKNNFDFAKYVLSRMEDISKIYMGKEEILGAAIISKDLERCKFVVENFANNFVKDKYENTKLMGSILCHRSHTKVVDYFAEIETDLEAVNKANENAIILACKYTGSAELIRKIIEKSNGKIDLNLKDISGNTAITLLYKKGKINIDMLRELLSAGADIQVKGWRNRSLMENQMSKSKRREIQEIIKEFDGSKNIKG